MANVPYMQFQPYNPVGTAIDSYSSISDALRRQQEMQMKKQMMPYQMQQLENQIALQNLGLEEQQARQPYFGQMAENELIQSQYANQKALADISVAQSSAKLHNAQIELANAKLPSEKAAAEAALQQALMDLEKNKIFSQYGAYDPESQKILSLMLLNGKFGGNQIGGQTPIQPNQSYAQEQMTTGQPQGIPSNGMQQNMPQGYLPPRQDQSMDMNQMIQQRIAESLMPESTIRGTIAGAEESAKQNVIHAQKQLEPINLAANNAITANQELQRMQNVWDRIPESQKGWVFGHTPARKGPAYEFDNAMQRMLQDAQQLWAGALSDNDIANIKAQFPQRTMDNDGFQKISNYIKEANNRVEMKQQFISDALANRYTFDQAQMAWNKYSQANPIVKSENKESRRQELIRKKGGQ